MLSREGSLQGQKMGEVGVPQKGQMNYAFGAAFDLVWKAPEISSQKYYFK